MDRLREKLLRELREMERSGRLLRSMSLGTMFAVEQGVWQPAVDVYETEDGLSLYVELAGIDQDSLSVVVGEQLVEISGRRRLPDRGRIACIHQLEIESGAFSRRVPLPFAVEVDGARSVYERGLLIVELPRKRRPGKITIEVAAGGG